MASNIYLHVTILSYFICKCHGSIVTSHTDVVLDLPGLATSQTASSHVCLHKCALNTNCNVACIGKVGEVKFVCQFFNVAKTTVLQNHFRQRKGFIVYEIAKPAEEPKVLNLST